VEEEDKEIARTVLKKVNLIESSGPDSGLSTTIINKPLFNQSLE
jgi:hypothetical protein